MWIHIAILESQYAQLASINTEFDDSTKIAIMIGTLENIDELESLATFVFVMKEADY